MNRLLNLQFKLWTLPFWVIGIFVSAIIVAGEIRFWTSDSEKYPVDGGCFTVDRVYDRSTKTHYLRTCFVEPVFFMRSVRSRVEDAESTKVRSVHWQRQEVDLFCLYDEGGNKLLVLRDCLANENFYPGDPVTQDWQIRFADLKDQFPQLTELSALD